MNINDNIRFAKMLLRLNYTLQITNRKNDMAWKYTAKNLIIIFTCGGIWLGTETKPNSNNTAK